DIRGPGNAGNDDEDAENLDPTSDYPDGVIAQRFETLEGGHSVHIEASGNARPVPRPTPVYLPEPVLDSITYFAFTLDVMEVITLDAILNWSLRFSIPCRRAIQPKSV